MWVYKVSERYQGNTLWTVGFYDPDGVWNPDSDHDDREEAAERTAWLNGSGTTSVVNSIATDDGTLAQRLADLARERQ